MTTFDYQRRLLYIEIQMFVYFKTEENIATKKPLEAHLITRSYTLDRSCFLLPLSSFSVALQPPVSCLWPLLEPQLRLTHPF